MGLVLGTRLERRTQHAAIQVWLCRQRSNKLRRRRQPQHISIRAGSTAHTDWLELLHVSRDLLDANLGVDIAPAPTFPPRDSPGMITVVTDASGNDGVGGYAFSADEPDVIYLMSEPWGDDTLRALANGAASEAERDCSAPSLSVSAAELFGAVALAAAVADERGTPASAITAVGDSSAAASVLNAATTGNAQMRALLPAPEGPIWLAVAVPREANVDADRLSHPAQYGNVEADATRRG